MYGPGTLAFSVGPSGAQSAQALELVDDTQPRGRRQLAGDLVAAALVVGRRTEAPRRRALQLDAGEEAVERQVEVEARLLAVGDHVEPGSDLVVDRRDDGIVLQLGAVGRSELVEVVDGVQQPAGQRIAADHRRAQSHHRSSPRTLQPASTVRVCPVIIRLSRLQRNTAAATTSSGSINPPAKGCLRFR